MRNPSDPSRRPENRTLARRLGGWLSLSAPPALFAFVSLRTTLLTGGYVLQVDTVFGPRAAPLALNVDAPKALLLHLLQATAGGQWTGKLAVFTALFLCGFGPMLVLRDRAYWVRCTAALLGMANPWVYDRLAEGQWGVVAAGGSLFVWLAAFDALQRKPGLGRAILVALASFLVVSMSANFAGILAVLGVAGVLGARVWRDRRRAIWTAAAVALASITLLYAVVPFFLEHGPLTYSAVQRFGRADWVTFRPTPDARYGPVAALAGLYGEWAERTGRIPVATAGNPWWILSAAILVMLAVAGAIAGRTRRWIFAAGALGLALAASTAWSPGVDAAVWLSDHVPLLAAYRDTQKWLALWLVALVVLGAEALAVGSRVLRRSWAGPAAAVVMALATLLPAGVTMLRELPELTRPADYPADWYAAAAYLGDNVPTSERVAVLPWHLYEPLDFTRRLTANPAPVFFPGTLIVPDDPELPGQSAPPPSPNGIAELSRSPEICALADGLRGMDVHWVVVEQTVGTSDVFRRLRSCGFRIAEGGPGLTSVLSG